MGTQHTHTHSTLAGQRVPASNGRGAIFGGANTSHSHNLHGTVPGARFGLARDCRRDDHAKLAGARFRAQSNFGNLLDLNVKSPSCYHIVHGIKLLSAQTPACYWGINPQLCQAM